MAQTSASFDTGRREYQINGYAFLMNPTDPDFITAFNDTLEEIGPKQEQMSEVMRKANAEEDSKAVNEALREYSQWGHEKVDALLGEGATEGIFGCSPFALQLDTRLPLWVLLCDNISIFIMDAIEELPDEMKTDSLRVNSQRSKAMVAKYRAKYKLK